MSPKEIENALKEVIKEIQDNSGLDCPNLEGSVVPPIHVDRFDSKVWLIATTMLAKKIKAEIPNTKNIFVDKDRNYLNIEQICKSVESFVTKPKDSKKSKDSDEAA